MSKTKKHSVCVNGLYASQIRKIIWLIFDVYPSHYKYDEAQKQLVFYIDDRVIDGEKRQAWKKKIEKKIGVRIIGI